jgi:hypothetical protein
VLTGLEDDDREVVRLQLAAAVRPQGGDEVVVDGPRGLAEVTLDHGGEAGLAEAFPGGSLRLGDPVRVDHDDVARLERHGRLGVRLPVEEADRQPAGRQPLHPARARPP